MMGLPARGGPNAVRPYDLMDGQPNVRALRAPARDDAPIGVKAKRQFGGQEQNVAQVSALR